MAADIVYNTPTSQLAIASGGQWLVVSGNITASAKAAAHGPYGMLVSPGEQAAARATDIPVSAVPAENASKFMGLNLRVLSWPSHGDEADFVIAQLGSGTAIARVVLGWNAPHDITLSVDDGSGSDDTDQSTEVLAASRWHSIVVELNRSTNGGADGYVKAYLDDVEVCALENRDNYAEVGTGVISIISGMMVDAPYVSNGRGLVAHIDDVAIGDSYEDVSFRLRSRGSLMGVG